MDLDWEAALKREMQEELIWIEWEYEKATMRRNEQKAAIWKKYARKFGEAKAQVTFPMDPAEIEKNLQKASSEDWKVRLHSISWLAEMAPKSEKVMERLLAVAADEHHEVRLVATTNLLWLCCGSSTSEADVISSRSASIRDLLISCLESPDLDLCRAMVRALEIPATFYRSSFGKLDLLEILRRLQEEKKDSAIVAETTKVLVLYSRIALEYPELYERVRDLLKQDLPRRRSPTVLLATLRTVARCGSINAARVPLKLGDHRAVDYRISSLEDALGVRLISSREAEGRKQSDLTDEGHALVEWIDIQFDNDFNDRQVSSILYT